MAKQIRNYLRLNPKLSEFFSGYVKDEPKKPRHENYFLDDIVDKNPTKFCPECNSSKVKYLPTHNMDGSDYHCKSCNLEYTILYFDKKEGFF